MLILLQKANFNMQGSGLATVLWCIKSNSARHVFILKTLPYSSTRHVRVDALAHRKISRLIKRHTLAINASTLLPGPVTARRNKTWSCHNSNEPLVLRRHYGDGGRVVLKSQGFHKVVKRQCLVMRSAPRWALLSLPGHCLLLILRRLRCPSEFQAASSKILILLQAEKAPCARVQRNSPGGKALLSLSLSVQGRKRRSPYQNGRVRFVKTPPCPWRSGVASFCLVSVRVIAFCAAFMLTTFWLSSSAAWSRSCSLFGPSSLSSFSLLAFSSLLFLQSLFLSLLFPCR